MDFMGCVLSEALAIELPKSFLNVAHDTGDKENRTIHTKASPHESR